jgi:two-component system, chemotaxis family, sensor kinase CheA
MLTSIQDKQSVDSATVGRYKIALEIELAGSANEASANASVTTPAATENAEVADEVELTEQGWKIAFCPYLDLLKTGNDPVRMFRELAELGEYSVSVNTHDIPAFYELDHEECNLSWALEVVGDIPLAEIKEIFNWVEGDCELDIQPFAKKIASLRR